MHATTLRCNKKHSGCASCAEPSSAEGVPAAAAAPLQAGPSQGGLLAFMQSIVSAAPQTDGAPDDTAAAAPGLGGAPVAPDTGKSPAAAAAEEQREAPSLPSLPAPEAAAAPSGAE